MQLELVLTAPDDVVSALSWFGDTERAMFDGSFYERDGIANVVNLRDIAELLLAIRRDMVSDTELTLEEMWGCFTGQDVTSCLRLTWDSETEAERNRTCDRH